MFLSLVRPDRISSPITRSAAVTTSLGTGTVVMITCGRHCPPYPAIVGYAASSRDLPGSGRMLSPIGTGTRESSMPAPAPLRPIAYAPPRIVVEKAPDGGLRCRSREPLAPYDPSLARLFRAAAERNPDGLF